MTPEEIAADERRRAIRALLARPLLLAGRDDDALLLVRRQAAALTAFFREELGWSLHLGADLVRLAKTPGRVDDPSRGLVGRGGEPLTRRRYVLIALAMAALCRADRQVTLHQVAEEVVLLAAQDDGLTEAGFRFALDTQSDRRDLVAAMAFLLDHGVLTHVDGLLEGFVRHRADVLYRVEHEVLARLPIWRVPPSLTRSAEPEARLWELLGEPPDAEAAEALRRHRVARRVVDDPVVYYADLEEPYVRYLTAIRGTLLRRLADATGLELESRREGVALVDPSGQLSDESLPDEGTEGHVTLLVAEHLASLLPAGTATPEALASFMVTARETHGAYWRTDAREPGHEAHYVSVALRRLFALDLVRPAPDGSVRPMPAIARYAVVAPLLVQRAADAQGRLDV